MQSRLPLVATTLVGALLLGACASPSLKSPTASAAAGSTAPASGAAPAAATAQAQPTAQSQVANIDLTRSAQAAPQSMAAPSPYIYFDFDSAAIRDEFMPTVEQHARLLSGDRNQRLRIAGHTDERGGREYNLALGQQRAESVSRALTLLGVGADRIEAVSYGEERPKAEGGSEQAWQKNRRAELRTQR